VAGVEVVTTIEVVVVTDVVVVDATDVVVVDDDVTDDDVTDDDVTDGAAGPSPPQAEAITTRSTTGTTRRTPRTYSHGVARSCRPGRAVVPQRRQAGPD
jgi:hypothetical protein